MYPPHQLGYGWLWGAGMIEAGQHEGQSPDAKLMRLRYAGSCETCNATLSAGTTAWYDRSRRKVRCQSCLPSAPEAQPFASGTAGDSAAREYQRRSERHQQKVQTQLAEDAAWRKQVKHDHPILGGIVSLVTPKPAQGPEPQHVKAWKTGSDGERKVGARLDAWAEATGGRVLHDRRIPPGKANIDHIALNSESVWIIDAKEYKGTVSSSGGILTQPELHIAGRRKTHLADAVRSQMDRVAAALDAAAAGDRRPLVFGVLCFVGADWPLFGGTFTINGITVAWPAATVKLLTPKAGHNDPAQPDRWVRVLADAFPPA